MRTRDWQSGSLCHAVAVLLALGIAELPGESTLGAVKPLPVGSRKQLFIDHKFIASKDDVDLVVNPPKKCPDAVLRSDKPWEAFSLIYFSVAEDRGIFKMWYQAFDGKQWSGGKSWMMFATSADGFQWTKPGLGLVDYKGSAENNILLNDCKLEYVFLDTNPKVPPGQQYKMLGGGGDSGVTRLRTSPDGIHWSELGPVVWYPWFDTQKQAWWDADLGKYVIYTRGYTANSQEELPFPFVEPVASNPPVVQPKVYRAGRMLARVETDDIMQPWPQADCRSVFCCDELDPPESDIYHPGGVYKYPYAADAYFMFPWIYEHAPHSPVPNDGVLEVQFAASRDGWHWMRYDREVYIRRGAKGEPDTGMIETQGPFFRRGDELYQFYTTWPWSHGGFRALTPKEQDDPANWGRCEYHLAKYRLDQFVSADAPDTGGWLVTPPIIFSGDHLELNISVQATGTARAELQDAKGHPISGFCLEDCERILSNDVAHTVRWKGYSDLSALAGRSVRLKIAMQSAKLYAFQFADGN